MNRFMRNTMFASAAVGLVLSAGSASANAWLPQVEGFSPSHDGTVNPLPCPLCDSTTSFAVWQNDTNGWLTDAPFAGRNVVALDSAFAGGAVVDNNAKYVYLYQVINTNRADPEQGLENFNISIEYKPPFPFPDPGNVPNPFTSGGYIENTLFFNPSRQTTPTDTPFDWTPLELTTVTPLVDGDGVAPTDINYDLINNAQVLGGTPFPGIQFRFTNLIPTDDTSTILWLTSDIGPNFVWAETESPGGIGEAFDVPGIKLPEPASVVLLGLGLAAFGLIRRRAA